MTITTPNGHVIGEKVSTHHFTFLVDGDLYSAYYSHVEIDGKMCMIKDESYKTGRVHAMTRKEARRLAQEHRERIIERLCNGPKGNESTEQARADKGG